MDTSASSLKRDGDTPDENVCKKSRTCEASCSSSSMRSDITDSIFVDFPEDIINALKLGLQYIMDDKILNKVLLTPFKIRNSNAADSQEGYSFSKAYCSTERQSIHYCLGSIFKKGLSILIEFMCNRTTPKNKQEEFVLSKLLHFLLDIQLTDDSSLENMNMQSETELTSILANHLFSKLSTSSMFVIDKHCKGKTPTEIRGNEEKPLCPCGRSGCLLSGDYGDTSIGNLSVWHGNLDIIINNNVVVAGSQVDEKGDNSPGGKSPMEVKLNSRSLSGNQQIIAQNIVFSFLQKRRHPESDNFLFPCIGVTGDDMIIYFYDSQHDVLLESSLISFNGPPLYSMGGFDIVAIIISWLVVNYKYLCDGVMQEMKAIKAEFFSHAKPKFDIYKTQMKAGDLGQMNAGDLGSTRYRNRSAEKKVFHDQALSELNKRVRSVVFR